MPGQLEKGMKIGQYEVIGPLGRGGMASVYRAYQANLDREVAIKVMAEQFASDPAFVERFRREARSIARLQHPNILTVYDAGEDNGVLYIVMELIEGETLKEELNGKPLSLERTTQVLSQVASALDYANSRGIIHRDVKPSNVLIAKNGRAVLSDFGIAKMVQANTQLTGTGVGVGTPDYMSPEQAMGEELDARSDEYSLGVMVYEMLTGRVPFTGDTPIAIVMGHVSKPLPSVRQLNPQIPPSVEQVLNKVLSKKPVERFEGCSAFEKAFATAVQNPGQIPDAVATQVMSNRGTGENTAVASPTNSNSEGERLYQQARTQEQQNNFYGAFDTFNQLNNRYPNYRDVPGVLERYHQMGYTRPNATPPTMPNMPGTGWQQPVPTPTPTNYYNTGGTGGFAPTPPPMPNMPAPHPNNSNRNKILAGIGLAVVLLGVALAAIIGGGGGSKTNPTATVIAAASPTTLITTAPATATTVSNVTTAANVTTARPTTAPNVTTAAPATTAAVATTAPVVTSAVGGNVTIRNAVLARDYKDLKPVDPTTNFRPSDRVFHCVVNLDNSVAGTKVKAVYSVVEAQGTDPQVIVEPEYEVKTKEDVLDFTATLPRDWPTGKYKVELYVNNVLSKSLDFNVVADAAKTTVAATTARPTTVAATTAKPTTKATTTPGASVPVKGLEVIKEPFTKDGVSISAYTIRQVPGNATYIYGLMKNTTDSAISVSLPKITILDGSGTKLDETVPIGFLHIIDANTTAPFLIFSTKGANAKKITWDFKVKKEDEDTLAQIYYPDYNFKSDNYRIVQGTTNPLLRGKVTNNGTAAATNVQAIAVVFAPDKSVLLVSTAYIKDKEIGAGATLDFEVDLNNFPKEISTDDCTYDVYFEGLNK